MQPRRPFAPTGFGKTTRATGRILFGLRLHLRRLPEEPHDGGYVNDESWASIGASSTAKAEAADSPFEAMETGYKFYNVDDDFENYLMYRPSGTNSIWVTLSVIEWHWDGSATYANNRWSLDPGSHPNKPGQGIKGSASTSLPEWDSYFGILKYR